MEWKHDHVHVLFRAHPKSGISKFINACKSAGGTLLSVIKQYIESQGEKR
jgi:putative transposase